MLFFRLTLVPIQEGKMEDAMSFAEEKVDEFMGIPGYCKLHYVKIAMVNLCLGQPG